MVLICVFLFSDIIYIHMYRLLRKGVETVENKILHALRYVVQIFLPALITFIGAVGMVVDYEDTTLIMTLLGALAIFIGTLIGTYPPEAVKPPGESTKDD